MPRSSARERARRRHRVLQLLTQAAAETQEELVEQLRAEGFQVTQATVSRDLDDLGAVRVRHGDRHVYALAGTNGPPAGIGIRMLPDLLIDAIPSGNLVVVRTFPGMAPTVGAILDQAGVQGVIGTVAGDDTVLVVAAEGAPGKGVANRIRKLGARAS